LKELISGEHTSDWNIHKLNSLPALLIPRRLW